MDILFVIILGALWGSFANVCIYRLPNDENVVSGRSFCPKCKQKIVWYDNIPVISFVILKAKCRNCDYKISYQYLVVETLSLLSFTLIYFLFGISITTLLFWILYLCFVIIFFIDLKHFIIPNVITFPLMALGFFKSFDPNLSYLFPNYLNSLIGGAFGLCSSLYKKDIKIFSLGKMIWPHLLARAMLTEQIYRSASIMLGNPYHKS